MTKLETPTFEIFKHILGDSFHEIKKWLENFYICAIYTTFVQLNAAICPILFRNISKKGYINDLEASGDNS